MSHASASRRPVNRCRSSSAFWISAFFSRPCPLETGCGLHAPSVPGPRAIGFPARDSSATVSAYALQPKEIENRPRKPCSAPDKYAHVPVSMSSPIRGEVLADARSRRGSAKYAATESPRCARIGRVAARDLERFSFLISRRSPISPSTRIARSSPRRQSGRAVVPIARRRGLDGHERRIRQRVRPPRGESVALPTALRDAPESPSAIYNCSMSTKDVRRHAGQLATPACRHRFPRTQVFWHASSISAVVFGRNVEAGPGGDVTRCPGARVRAAAWVSTDQKVAVLRA